MAEWSIIREYLWSTIFSWFTVVSGGLGLYQFAQSYFPRLKDFPRVALVPVSFVLLFAAQYFTYRDLRLSTLQSTAVQRGTNQRLEREIGSLEEQIRELEKPKPTEKKSQPPVPCLRPIRFTTVPKQGGYAYNREIRMVTPATGGLARFYLTASAWIEGDSISTINSTSSYVLSVKFKEASKAVTLLGYADNPFVVTCIDYIQE